MHGATTFPHAGSATFWGWVHGLDWRKTLADALPHPPPLANNHLLPLEKALPFMHGRLCDARKLTHVAYLHCDPLVSELLVIKRVASRLVLTWFFQEFTSAGDELAASAPAGFEKAARATLATFSHQQTNEPEHTMMKRCLFRHFQAGAYGMDI